MSKALIELATQQNIIATHILGALTDIALELRAAPVRDRDALLLPEEMAKILSISPKILLQNVRRKKIPVVKINARVLRFHLPTVLVELQKVKR